MIASYDDVYLQRSGKSGGDLVVNGSILVLQQKLEKYFLMELLATVVVPVTKRKPYER